MVQRASQTNSSSSVKGVMEFLNKGTLLGSGVTVIGGVVVWLLSVGEMRATIETQKRELAGLTENVRDAVAEKTTLTLKIIELTSQRDVATERYANTSKLLADSSSQLDWYRQELVRINAALAQANPCLAIQNRISEIESSLAYRDIWGGDSAELAKQYKENQESLRACVGSYPT